MIMDGIYLAYVANMAERAADQSIETSGQAALSFDESGDVSGSVSGMLAIEYLGLMASSTQSQSQALKAILKKIQDKNKSVAGSMKKVYDEKLSNVEKSLKSQSKLSENLSEMLSMDAIELMKHDQGMPSKMSTVSSKVALMKQLFGNNEEEMKAATGSHSSALFRTVFNLRDTAGSGMVNPSNRVILKHQSAINKQLNRIEKHVNRLAVSDPSVGAQFKSDRDLFNALVQSGDLSAESGIQTVAAFNTFIKL